MKLWCISDWHMETRLVFEPPRPDFDVLVCAGDVEEHMVRAIEIVAALAGGMPAVFVAGNHDWRGPETIEAKLDAAHYAARKHGVHFLECDTCDIGGVRFAGATLWTPDDVRFAPSATALIKAGWPDGFFYQRIRDYCIEWTALDIWTDLIESFRHL